MADGFQIKMAREAGVDAPDVAAAIQRTKGRLWPLGWLQILWEARRTEWVTFNGVGVVPKYQGAGVNAVLYAELARSLQREKFNFQHGDSVQAAETNVRSMGDGSALGGEWFKTHRVYRAEL